jgi:hypothetical protein
MKICVAEKPEKVIINENHSSCCWMCVKNIINKSEISRKNLPKGGGAQ